MKKLKEKAGFALSQHRSSTNGEAHLPNISFIGSQDDGTDELALFGGRTSMLFSGLKTSSPDGRMKPGHVGLLSSSGLPSPSTNQAQDPESLEYIHPSLLQYLPVPQSNTVATQLTADNTPHFVDPLAELEQPAATMTGFNPIVWNEMGYGQAQSNIQSQSVEEGSWHHPSTQPFIQDTSTAIASTSAMWGANDMRDLGQMMDIDSDMDEQWMLFIRDSGLGNPTAVNNTK